MKTIDYKVTKNHWGNLELFVKQNDSYVRIFLGEGWMNRDHQLKEIRRALENIIIADGDISQDIYQNRMYL